jgi:hypothetical protein
MRCQECFGAGYNESSLEHQAVKGIGNVLELRILGLIGRGLVMKWIDLDFKGRKSAESYV